MKYKRKILSNGMTVVFEKRDLPIVAIGFAVKQGGVNEGEDEKGISHFIEHMLYKGTKNRSYKQIADEIEKNGGRLNGLTDERITAFYCKMPSNKLKIGLNVLSDLVQNPKFDPKELEKERKVIYEEIKMRRDRPNVYVMDEIQSFLYKKPFGLNLIGSEKTMSKVRRDVMIEKFRQVYTPENMVLVVVGDADFNYFCDFVEKNFKKKSGKISTFDIVKKSESKIEKRKGIDQVNLVLAFHCPLLGEKGSYAAKVLSVLMGGGMSSRLWAEIREKRNMAYVVSCDSTINRDYSYCVVYVGTKTGNEEKVKKLILEEFEKASKDLTEKELDEVKEQIIGNYHISMEDSVQQMENLLVCERNDCVKEYYEFEEHIKKVKLEDVKSIAKSVKNNYSFFALVPE